MKRFFLLLTFVVAAVSLRAQSLEPVAPTTGGIIISDTAQQVFVIMPVGVIEFKPVDLAIDVDHDEVSDLVSVKTNVTDREVAYVIYDAKGKTVMMGRESSKGWQMNLASLPRGVYLLSVSDGMTPAQQHRLILVE